MAFSIEHKIEKLKKIIESMGKVLIAYSGGADSTFLLKTAIDCLGKANVIAVTARSPFFPLRELEEAKKMAEYLGANHIIIEHNELEVEDIVKNSRARCYYCKKELFGAIRSLAKKYGISYVVEGTTETDMDDFRPGINAIREMGVRSPLAEANLKKEEIREISKMLSLPTHNKPSFACLASRFPYGMRITKEELEMVNKAEEFLLSFGFKAVRVRHYKSLARIEVEKKDIERFLDESIRKAVVDNLKKVGYVYVTLDLEGFRSGSMNEEFLREVSHE